MTRAFSEKGYKILSFIAAAGEADIEDLHSFINTLDPQANRKAVQVLMRYYMAQKWIAKTGARRVRITLSGRHKAGLSRNMERVYKICPDRLTGLQLTALRTHCGMNQQQFADAMGVNVRTVSRWETGAVPIPGRVITALSKLKLSTTDN